MSVGLGLLGPETPTGVVPEGDYTLTVGATGPLAAAINEVTLDWGDGNGRLPASLGQHTINLEGDVPLTDYTVTATAVARPNPVATPGQSVVADAVVDSSGRRITVAGNQVRRYGPDGTADDSFGPTPGGLVTLDAGVDLHAVALNAAGDIIVAGNSGGNFAVRKLSSTNGVEDGYFATNSAALIAGADAGATSLAIQSDGKIVVGGNVGLGTFAVARYLATGAPDTNFSGDGVATTPVSSFAPLTDVALQTSGTTTRILAFGNTGLETTVIAAYTDGGDPDTTFAAVTGVRTFDATGGSETTRDAAVLGDGSILLAGEDGNGRVFLAKLTAAGEADLSFGAGDGFADGRVRHDYDPFANGVFFDAMVGNVVVQDDLSIVVGGTLKITDNGSAGGLAMFRFDAAGNRDGSFGTDGLIFTDGGTDRGVSGGYVALHDLSIVQSGTQRDADYDPLVLGSTPDDSDAVGVYHETVQYCVAVANVAPTGGFRTMDPNEGLPWNPTSVVPGQFYDFAFIGSDPSSVDASILAYHVDWGDGTTDMVAEGAHTAESPSLFAHAFQASGLLTVTLTVTDEDGASDVETMVVEVAATSGFIDDPASPGQSVVIVAAPVNQANKISVSSSTSLTSVVVDGATVFYDTAGPVHRVVVYGNTGDDTIQVSGTTSAAVMEFYGGAGADKLKGSDKADVMVGGAGDDLLVGGAGRDFLIGGLGADKVVGDADDDILIGGVYADVFSREAVVAVMAEWTSSRCYTERVDYLRYGGGANGPYGLVGYATAEETVNSPDPRIQNVFDDGAVDKLTGDAGTDWFFANVDGPAVDKITDLLSPEFTDADREFVNEA